jgi:hypothetical protein
MAMITGFLIAYTCFTAPLIVWGFWNAVRKHDTKPHVTVTAGKMSDEDAQEIMSILKDPSMEKELLKGMEIHAIEENQHPKTFDQAFGTLRADILDQFRQQQHILIDWFTAIRDNQDDNKRDMGAMLQATQTIARSMLEIKEIASSFSKGQPHKYIVGTEETSSKNRDQFAAYFEYVRDNFPMTPTETKVVNKIISNLKSETYGGQK